MKVAVNTLFLIPGEVGGSETYLCETLRAMMQHQADVEFALITNRENDAPLQAAFGASSRVSFHRLPVTASNRPARIVAEQTLLPWLLRRLRPDLLWSPGYTMPMRAPCPQVLSILDMQYRSHPDDLTRIARWTTHFLVMGGARRADAVLTISNFSRDEIIRETGCAEELVTVTPLGVDPAFASDVGEERRQAVRTNVLGGNAPCILCVANSYPHKNLHVLGGAFATIADRIPHHLVLVGHPRLGEQALQEALSKVPPGRVHRVGRLPREELIALYQGAHLFSFPSLYEGFGLPILEALMAGVPVMASGRAATREVGGDAIEVADGTSVSDWADVLHRMVGWSESERQSRIQAGRAHAAAWTWQRTAASTLEVFRRIGGVYS